MSAIFDRDPGDEGALEHHPESTGLCASPWCDDAAIPDEDYCMDCAGDLENMEREALEAARKARVDEFLEDLRARERWIQSMVERFGDVE